MRQTEMIRPEYSEKFLCIGSACEDDCCHGWDVHIDKQTFDKYQSLPAGPLRTMIDVSVMRVDDSRANPFASIRLLADGRCPFHSEERMCQIQKEYGAGHLSETCATYPRRTLVIDGLEDKTLALSCPEAARMVLLDPKVFQTGGNGGYRFTWDETKNVENLRFYFWPIRELSINLVRNRAYPLWQRIFLLGTFARRLEAIASGELQRSIPALLKDFAAAIAQGSLRPAMETIPADLALQLDLVLSMMNLRLQSDSPGRDMALSPRVKECLQEFLQGIGMEPESTVEGLKGGYARAYERHYAPFFLRHPHILENYLINSIIRETFPFGPALFSDKVQPDFGKAFTRLVMQFALIKGILIGVAGFYKDAFCQDHVVRTAQTASRYFEHSPQFLEQALALLASREADDARGLTMLVRN